MSIKTNYYFLTAFLDGDIYSASSDFSRFQTVDNQLHRASEIIGDGVIDGWDIIDNGFPNIKITNGSGLIDGFYTTTINNKFFNLDINSIYNIYAQRRIIAEDVTDNIPSIRPGVIPVDGPNSNILSVTYTDNTPPSKVQNFIAETDPYNINVSINSFSVSLWWEPNTEIDLEQYIIQRSTDNISFTQISSVPAGTHEYTDSTVEEDTKYWYRIIAVDFSGNQSPSNTILVITPVDIAPPPNPVEIILKESDSAINILWKKPPTLPDNKLNGYHIEITQMNSDFTPIDSTTLTFNIDKELYNYRVDELTNGESYKVTIQSIDIKNRISTGVVGYTIPQQTSAPLDPENITYTTNAGSNGNIIVNLSWSPGDNPYHPFSSYRFLVYTQIDNQNESFPVQIPIDSTSHSISLYTRGENDNRPIPENTLVTFRISAIGIDSEKSNGSYIRFITPRFSKPNKVKNLISRFDPRKNQIIISWNNNQDTSSVLIQIYKQPIENPTSSWTLVVNKNIDHANVYYMQDAEINTKYKIVIITFDIFNTQGDPSTIFFNMPTPNDLLLPDPPLSIFTRSGDKEITLIWQSSSSDIVAFYNIYKNTGDISFDFADWSLLDTIKHNSEELKFVDYGLENDQTYSYYITSIDHYGRESDHLSEDYFNLNFVEVSPNQSSPLTAPDLLSVEILNDNAVLSWSTFNEEFDSFNIYRSNDNLHDWIKIDSVDKDTLTYTDTSILRKDNIVIYYMLEKVVHNANIIAQLSSVPPNNSVFLGTVQTFDVSMKIDISGRRIIKDMKDSIGDYADKILFLHKHKEISINDPERINLSKEIIVDDWTTVDNRFFSTTSDISGTSHIVKVNGKFPTTFFKVDTTNKLLIFTESVDPNASIEVRVIGGEEVTNTLDSYRINNIHARQIATSKIKKEQLDSINHEGRIQERMSPLDYLLERYNNYTFIVPQGNSDETKTFGDSTVFYTVQERDGFVRTILDFDEYDIGSTVSFAGANASIAEVSTEQTFQQNKSYKLQFSFANNSSTQWIPITTDLSDNQPNPIIDLNKKLRFWIYLESGSFYLSLGIREISQKIATVGGNGGTTGPIEWVGTEQIVEDTIGNIAPIGKLISSNSNWQLIEFDIPNEKVVSFENGNSNLDTSFGVLQHLALTIDVSSSNNTGPFVFYLGNFEQTDDLLVSGTSQGILISKNFGVNWDLSRYTTTPVKKLYNSINNSFLWAISSNQVFLSKDPQHWFATSGTLGINNIRDIIEDDSGNMYISTDKGVYRLSIALIINYSIWKQTNLINAFSTDCYGMYHKSASSSSNYISLEKEEIWVSNESGIFRTLNSGDTWSNTNFNTFGRIIYQFIDVDDDPYVAPVVFGISKTKLFRIINNHMNIVADLDEQHNVSEILTMEYFSGKLYLSTDIGIVVNEYDVLQDLSIINIQFKKVFGKINKNGITTITYSMNSIRSNNNAHQLFLGQEDNIWISDENNQLSLKWGKKNKNTPVFFIDGQEVKTGLTYNSFNNVLVFRDPISTSSIVSASYLPIQTYESQNKGWAQTNPGAEVFIHLNGEPKWVDFKFNEDNIKLEIDNIKVKLNNINGTLTTFNSDFPDSSDVLTSTLSNIDNVISEVSSNNILNFITNYNMLLSMLNESVINTNNLVSPKILLSGVSSENRVAESRAETLVASGQINPNDSTGIDIDIVSGNVTFTKPNEVFDLQSRNKFKFNHKYDRVEISVYNSNVTGVGSNNHREIEDKLEKFNSGLSSGLARNVYSNFIKTGIFVKTHNNNIFDNNTQNIQSKYNNALSRDWYDIIDSTIDYKSVIKVKKNQEANFINKLYLFNGSTLWAGTDKDIFTYSFNNGVINHLDIIRPGSGLNTLFIRDIFVDNDDIYVVSYDVESNKSQIWTSNNIGSTWSEISTIGIENIFSFSIINGTKVAGTMTGVFYNDNNFNEWFPSEVESTGDSFTKQILNMETDSTFIIVESQNSFALSSDGMSFIDVGNINNNIQSINKIKRFKHITWIATDIGVLIDNNTILSDNVAFGILSDSFDEKVTSKVNDIDIGGDSIYMCDNNGFVYRFLKQEWLNYKVPGFDTIHKMLYYNNFLIVTSYNQIKVLDVTNGTGVFL